jgi:hypothetical protein
MSTLTALKLERELEIARRAIAGAAERPRLVRRWLLDTETGRPVAVWTQVRETVDPAATPAGTFA